MAADLPSISGSTWSVGPEHISLLETRREEQMLHKWELHKTNMNLDFITNMEPGKD